MSEQTSPATTELMDLAGKYLTFQLGAEEYAIEIMRVREIIGLMDITDVPRTPEHIRGVINLRGRIIPVLDLRVRFGMDSVPDSDETCIIVVETNNGSTATQMGILVDRVCEVMDITQNELEAPPSFGDDVDSSFILGMAKRESDVTILLNVACVLSSAEAAAATTAASQG